MYRSRFESNLGDRGNVGMRGNYNRGNRRYDHNQSYGSAYGGRHGGDMSFNHQVVNPWEGGAIPDPGSARGHSGFMPPHGGTGGSLLGEFRGSSDIVGSINHLTRMGNPESKLALNILNAVLAKDEGRSQWSGGPPADKRRRMDTDGGYDIHRGQSYAPSMHHLAHKVPHRDHQYSPHRAGNIQSQRRGKGGRSFGQAGRQMMTQQQPRRTMNVKRGKPIISRGLAKNQKKKGETTVAATGTAGGQKGDKTEGGDSSATADPKQSAKGGKSEKEIAEGTGEEVDDAANSKKASPGNTVQEGDKNAISINKSLRCHICNFYSFSSTKTFRNHLESTNHERMQRIYHIKEASILQFLRAQSKLASQRNILRLRRLGAKGRIMQCTKCLCPFMGSLADHRKTREHLLVSNFSKCTHCNLLFDNRIELEKHCFSYFHMMREAVLEKKRKERLITTMKIRERIPEYAPFRKFHIAVEKLKRENKHTKHGNVFDLSRMPVYDPANLIGLNFITKKSHFYCTICSDKLIQSPSETLAHFSSLQHYEKYTAHLKSLEEKKADKENQEDSNQEIVQDDKNETNDGESAEKDSSEDEEDEKEEVIDEDEEEMDTNTPAANKKSEEQQQEEDECVVSMTDKLGDTLELLEEDDDALLDSDVDDEVKESLTKCKAMDDGDVLPVLEDAVEIKTEAEGKVEEEMETEEVVTKVEKVSTPVKEVKSKKEEIETVKKEMKGVEEKETGEKDEPAPVVSTPRSRRGKVKGRGRGGKK